MLVAVGDFNIHQIAHLQAELATVLDVHQPIDFRRIGTRAGHRDVVFDHIHQALLHAADLGFQTQRRDLRLLGHEARQALLFHFFGHLIRQRVGAGAIDRRIRKRTDAVQLRLIQEVQQGFEFGIGLAGEADDEGRAHGDLRAHRLPALHALQGFFHRAGALHQLENARAGVLERNVQIRQQLAFGHQPNHIVHVRIRVHVMQARPHAKLRQPLAQRLHAGLVQAVPPRTLGIFQVHTVGRGVLRHHQQFLDATAHQPLGFAQHFIDRTRDQIAAHRGNDAEAAPVIAAFGNLEIRVMARRQLDAVVRHQIHERVVTRRQRGMHCLHDALVVLRAGYRQHLRVRLANLLRALAQAAGDDDLAVGVHRLADRVQRFGHCRIDEAAGVDHHHIGSVVAGHDVVALYAQLGEDAFGIDERLRAAKADEADFRVQLGHGSRSLGSGAAWGLSGPIIAVWGRRSEPHAAHAGAS